MFIATNVLELLQPRTVIAALRSTVRFRRASIIRASAFITIAIVLNILIFFVIQLMVTGDHINVVIENISLNTDFIRYKNDLSADAADTRPDELPEAAPEEQLPKPDIPRPDIAPPAALTAAPSPILAPELSLATNGLPTLKKILKFSSGGKLSSLKFATNLIPAIRIPPIYPQRALTMGIEGLVTVEFTIGIDGSVKDPVIVKARPEKIFDKAVLQAIKKWKYEPEMVDGILKEIRARQDISFNLSD